MNKRTASRHLLGGLLLVLWVFVATSAALAQSTGFSYQGRLTDGGTLANGNYDLQFALWDSLTGGGQVGSTQTLNTVPVSNGVFTVSLDFGANAFPGASRFLEISARPSGAGSFTLLTPRQPITSTPYAVRSLNAATADSVAASGVPAGSGNYIQNSSSPQASSNFNISGTGTANIVNATTQFNLNGTRILSSRGTNNLFVGPDVGTANATGNNNIFVGKAIGQANTTGQANSIFGSFAGEANTEGERNSFFGSNAGRSNTIGGFNSFFGTSAGQSNTQGANNSFFGTGAGQFNTQGANNSYFGIGAGDSATGSGNTFIGSRANFAQVADISPSGNRNTLLGANAALGSGGQFSPDNATAIGANARVDQANSLVLGSISGVNGATADTNVGIGTTTPTARLHVVGTTGLMGNVGIGNTSPQATLHVVGNLIVSNDVQIGVLRSGGATQLCRNASNQISTCSSSLRYKTEIKPFLSGLNIVNRLRPISFVWKEDLRRDVGLGAEEVAQVEPLLTFKNKDGEIEGVNYSQLTALLINAVKEQQQQIEKQQKQIEQQRALTSRQQQQLSDLKKLACRSHRRARVCR